MKAEPMDCWRVEHWAAVTALRLVLLRVGVMGCNWVTPTDSQTVSLTVSLRGRWTVPLTVSLMACWRVAMRGVLDGGALGWTEGLPDGDALGLSEGKLDGDDDG